MVINDCTDCETISMEDCQLVADKLNITFVQYNATDYPPNCSVFQSSYEVIFNNNTDSIYDCSYVDLCVCEKHSGGGPAPGNCTSNPSYVL